MKRLSSDEVLMSISSRLLTLCLIYVLKKIDFPG